MASVEELPPETGAHSEGFATPIGGGLPSESGDVVAHDLQEQFRGELLQLDEKYPGLGEKSTKSTTPERVYIDPLCPPSPAGRRFFGWLMASAM